MTMMLHNVSRSFLKRLINSHVHRNQIRTLLSSAYSCQEEWEARKQDPILAKVDGFSYFNELRQRYVRDEKVHAVDVDILANVVERSEQLVELQSILSRLRRTRATLHTPPSTHHAVCRAFLAAGQIDRLMQILEDPVNYGIFPDVYCYNMLMDYCIENDDYRNGMKIAKCLMLQEDFGNEITKKLALLSVYNYMIKTKPEDHKPWYDDEDPRLDKLFEQREAARREEAGDDDDEDAEYIRVPYVENPYFDDHFDLLEPDHLCGKTTWAVGRLFNPPLGLSLQILGLVYHEKWEQASSMVCALNGQLLKETVDLVNQYIEKLPENYKHQEKADQFKQLLNSLKSDSLSQQSFEELVEAETKDLEKYEDKDIQEMKKIYPTWLVDRKSALHRSIEEMEKRALMSQIDLKKEEIKEKEKILYFFENFAKHEMDFHEAEKKIEDLKGKQVIEEEYLPPSLEDIKRERRK